jgi:hypothetical protein
MSQRLAVLALVRQCQGWTSAELARWQALRPNEHAPDGLDRYQIARRLPELEQAGLVYRGEVRQDSGTGRTGVVWWPSPWIVDDTEESIT